MKETRFKQTEIGLIPEDWEIYDINKIGIFSKGAGISRNESMTGKIPAIRYGEIYTHHNNVLRNFNSWISVSVAAKSTKIKCNDLLFTASGETKEEIGKCVAYIYDYDAYAGGDIIILTPRNHHNSIFLGYLMNSQIICKQKASKGQGDAVVHITANSLSKIKCPIPDSEEQNKIASALTSIDNLLLSLDKLIEKKRLIKQGAMQELLTGKKRLPGFTGEWVEKKLGEGLRFKPGFPFNSNFFDERMGIRLIRNRDLKADDQITYFYGNINKDFIIANGDLLIGMDGDFMPCLWNKGKALLNQRVGKIELISNNWCLMYLFYALQEPLKAKQEKTGATTVKHLSHSDIEQMRLKMPSTSIEQEVIGEILSSMDKEIESLEDKKAKYERIKQGMMQQLLTGKIRLIS